MIKSVFLVFALSGALFAQQGTRPDPMAGQTSAQPAATPTNTPQAQQDASPAAAPPKTQPDNAAPAQASAPETNQTPAASPGQSSSPQSAPNQTQQNNSTKPQTDNFTASNVELTPPVTGSPTTKIIDASAVGKHSGLTGAPDPLLDTPPLPKGKPTLIGGTATKVDRIRSRITVEPFGAKNKMTIMVDERTHIFRNGVETTIEKVKKGDRVYFDTMLDGPKIFAKNVRVVSETGAAEVRGQITAYDPGRGIIQLNDALSSRPVSFKINSSTKVSAQQGSATVGDLGCAGGRDVRTG